MHLYTGKNVDDYHGINTCRKGIVTETLNKLSTLIIVAN